MRLHRTLIIPDTHAPYHSERAWRTAMKAAHALKPDRIVCIGDFVDCYSISRYPKSAARKHKLKPEIESARALLRQLERIGASELVFCEGNHEWRLERYINERAPELFGLIDIRSLLHLDSWRWVPYQSWVTYGKISYSHDVGRSGVYAGRQTLAEFGGNIVFGHTHRGGVTYESTVRGEHRVALNVGWLGNPWEIEYAHRASALRNSQHGFGWVLQDHNGYAAAQFVPIIHERMCIVDGRKVAL